MNGVDDCFYSVYTYCYAHPNQDAHKISCVVERGLRVVPSASRLQTNREGLWYNGFMVYT